MNQNFRAVCHTDVCLTFSRLAAKLSEMITKFRGRSLKIQHRLSFDLNGLKNGTCKNFENSLKSMQIFQILMGGMNFRERLQKNQMSSAVRSVKANYPIVACLIIFFSDEIEKDWKRELPYARHYNPLFIKKNCFSRHN